MCGALRVRRTHDVPPPGEPTLPPNGILLTVRAGLCVAGLSHAFPPAPEIARLLAWWHPSFALPGEEVPVPAEPTPHPPPSEEEPAEEPAEGGDSEVAIRSGGGAGAGVELVQEAGQQLKEALEIS